MLDFNLARRCEYTVLFLCLIYEMDIVTTLQVREEMQQLPGGPDESSKIQSLSARIADAEKQAAELELQMTLRPVPSVDHELQQQIADFISRNCDPTSIRQMVARLVVWHFLLGSSF